jgi:hypothetical protein
MLRGQKGQQRQECSSRWLSLFDRLSQGHPPFPLQQAACALNLGEQDVI